MTLTIQIVTLVLVLLTLAGIGALFFRRQQSGDFLAPFKEHVDGAVRYLDDKFNKSTSDMAQRLEKVKSELRLETSDRLAGGFIDLKDAVGKQLTDGREEQSKSLGRELGSLRGATTTSLEGIRAEVDKKLLAIGGQVQGTTDKLSAGFLELKDAVGRQLSDGREEQSRSLNRDLGALGEATTKSLEGIRAEVDKKLLTVGGQVQGTTDKLSAGFIELKDAVGRQLAEGREEQSKSLNRELGTLGAATTKSLEGIRAEVDRKLLAIGDQVQQKLTQNIQSGIEQFQKVQEHLRAAEEQLRNVGEIGASINDLNSLLKMPHLRGKFGEEMLERLVQDFLPVSMYEFQVPAAVGVPGLVDVVIKFPERNLPIDAKFPREQVEALFEGRSPTELDAARVELVRVMKEQAKRIAAYIQPENGTTDMALMYLPSETLYMEVVLNREIVDHLNKLHIFPVSNNTLVVTLGSIQMVFKMYEFAKGFEKATEDLRKAQKSFGFFEKQFEDIGKSLTKAQDAFGTARRHLSTYTRRVTDLTGETVAEIDGREEDDDLA